MPKEKRFFVFCFFSLPRLFQFFFSSKARKKRQKISVETRNMLPLPTTTTHHHHYHHHHLGEEGHQQSTSDSEEMAFMASQLLDGNTTYPLLFFLLDFLLSRIFYNKIEYSLTSLSLFLLLLLSQRRHIRRRAERSVRRGGKHAQGVARVFTVDSYRERLADCRGGVGDERRTTATPTTQKRT